MFRRYVSKIQVFESWYVQTRQVGIRPNARVFLIYRYRFCFCLAILLEACAGCHLQASWTCTCISSLSFFFYSYRFLGRQCIGSVKVQAKLKWNARGYYTIQIAALGSGSLESWNPTIPSALRTTQSSSHRGANSTALQDWLVRATPRRKMDKAMVGCTRSTTHILPWYEKDACNIMQSYSWNMLKLCTYSQSIVKIKLFI